MAKGFSEVELTGEVVKKPFARGSKSERVAVSLDTGKKSYTLRVRGGHPFFDPRLDALVGKRIRCKGVLTSTTLIISEWSVIEEK
ncbi:MAG TPA: hypothetical protein VFX96_10025 [Pyrinomonadaceae bacterium]|nr:hypothetical protein [Pyrinomonadaceae bacterium]